MREARFNDVKMTVANRVSDAKVAGETKEQQDTQTCTYDPRTRGAHMWITKCGTNSVFDKQMCDFQVGLQPRITTGPKGLQNTHLTKTKTKLSMLNATTAVVQPSKYVYVCMYVCMSGGNRGVYSIANITSLTSRFRGRRRINPDVHSILLDILRVTIVTCTKQCTRMQICF